MGAVGGDLDVSEVGCLWYEECLWYQAMLLSGVKSDVRCSELMQVRVCVALVPATA